MPRRNSKAGGRKHDARISFKEACRRAGITPIQRIIMIRELRKKVSKKT